jgi:hypothetical protein
MTTPDYAALRERLNKTRNAIEAAMGMESPDGFRYALRDIDRLVQESIELHDAAEREQARTPELEENIRKFREFAEGQARTPEGPEAWPDAPARLWVERDDDALPDGDLVAWAEPPRGPTNARHPITVEYIRADAAPPAPAASEGARGALEWRCSVCERTPLPCFGRHTGPAWPVPAALSSQEARNDRP